jgi:acyl dehydratase
MSYALGRYFEDFTRGESLRTLGRTVTEADIVNFAGFTGDFNPLHTDEQFAAASPFKGRVAHGMCGFSIATGLMVRLNILEGTIMAFLGIENWRFKLPIRIGDTVHVIATVVEKTESSKPDRGLVKMDLDVINQDGESTQGGTLLLLMKRRPT